MALFRNLRGLSLFSTLLVVSLVWWAAPQASQEGANDGFILFVSDRAHPSTRGMCPNCEDIYVMSRDGSDPTRLTFGGGEAADVLAYNSAGPDWSHSKKLIVFQSNRENRIPQIYLMNADGTEQRPFVSLGAQGSAFPSFSQSGNEVCFQDQHLVEPVAAQRKRDIHIVNLHRTGMTNITSPAGARQAGNNARCDWSPKGNLIAFQSDRDGNDEIYVINADGSNVHRLTGSADEPVAGSDVNPAWSPKGDRIAFESNRTGKPEIWVMNADGSNAFQLTDFSQEVSPRAILVSKPTWSPDGRTIAFHRRVGAVTEAGHAEVYTVNEDRSDVRQITFTPLPGFSGFPSWAKWSIQQQ